MQAIERNVYVKHIYHAIKKKNASTTVHLQVSACTNSLTSVTQSASMCLCVSILVYNSTLCCPGNNKSERQRWIFSILKETDWRTPQRGAEKSCGLHCAISLSTRRHTFAQASVLCPLSVRGGYVTVAIVWLSWDGSFEMNWQNSGRLLHCRPVSEPCRNALAGALVTFSWPLPCCFLLWAGGGDNDTAHSPGWRGEHPAPSVTPNFWHLCHNICHSHLSQAHLDEFPCSGEATILHLVSQSGNQYWNVS